MSDVAIERNTLDRLAMKVSGVTNELPPLTLEEMITALDTAAHAQVHPHGTIPITENGQVDVTGYATADVQVPTGNEFLVTVSYNSSADMWLADKTYAELYEAYSAGKTIVWETGLLAEVATVAGEFHSGTTPYFSYFVRAIPTQGSVQEYGYELSASGLVQTEYNHYFKPSGTKTISAAGNTDVTNYATANVPAGTAGTPTATKGTVSNHQVTVTPSVTNTTGWITGSTKTGTGVTVTASELESGNLAITQNGNDISVEGYKTVSVDVSGGTSKNAQAVTSTTRVTSTSLTACSGTITVAKTGTYDVYWSTHRTSTSGTWSSRLYVNNTANGTEQTSGWSNHVQPVHLTGVSLTAGQTIRVYAKSRGSNYYAYVPLLTIIES